MRAIYGYIEELTHFRWLAEYFFIFRYVLMLILNLDISASKMAS